MSKKWISFSLGPSGSLVLDPSFPRIAAKAALEVDGALLRLQGKRAPQVVELVAVNALIPFMQKVASAAHAEDVSGAELDPASANVFLLAYGKIDPSSARAQSLSQLGDTAKRVVAILEKVAKQESSADESNELEYVRNFCRALSDQAAVRQHVPHATSTQGLLRR